MSQFPYVVSVITDGHHRTVGEFRDYGVARRAARHALEDRRCSIAIVKDQSGRWLFCADPRSEWEGEAEGLTDDQWEALSRIAEEVSW